MKLETRTKLSKNIDGRMTSSVQKQEIYGEIETSQYNYAPKSLQKQIGDQIMEGIKVYNLQNEGIKYQLRNNYLVLSKNLIKSDCQNHTYDMKVKLIESSLPDTLIDRSIPMIKVQDQQRIDLSKQYPTSPYKQMCLCKKIGCLPVWSWTLIVFIILLIVISMILIKKYTQLLGCKFGSHKYKNRCLVCPEVSFWNGTHCKANLTALSQYTLVDHDQISSQFVRIHKQKIQTSCSKGSEFINGRCIYCPPGSTLNQAFCLKNY